MLRRLSTALGVLVSAVVVLVASALPAWAAQAITLTWVRHAQSTANAAGIIDTEVPGPGLTALGETQAQAIAVTLGANAYDGIYVSDMIRTQLTAAPLAGDLGITPVVLPGVQEVNAGVFEGRSGVIAGIGYALPPVTWALGARFVPVLGGENGNGFEARVNEAVATIYATGETNPIVFSHGATITAWTLMNVDNPDLLLALTHPLGNTAVVVVAGDPEDGWTLQSWDGVAVDPNPGLLTQLFVDTRALVVAPQTSLYDIGQAIRTGDPAVIATAIRAGIVNVASAPIVFAEAVVRDVVNAVAGLCPQPPAAVRTQRPARKSSVTATRSPSRPHPATHSAARAHRTARAA